MNTAGGARATGDGAPARRRTPLDLPLGGGTTFIEASAGTGKTHALTTLVARLVLEEEWPIDRILVVTFTRAATAELRDRIRRVLGFTLAAVRARAREDGPGGGVQGLGAAVPDSEAVVLDSEAAVPEPDAVEPGIDPQARVLLAAWERRGEQVDYARAVRRLQAAMHDIDRANVFTIHGFCQRVLADLAFESGFPFGCEVGGDGGETVAGAVRDFWRRRLYPASTLLMRHAVENGFLPDGLAGWVGRRRAKVGAEVVGCDAPAEPIEARESAWREVFDAVRSQWERYGSGFVDEILEGPWLNRRSYRVPRARAEMAVFGALFAAAEPRLPPSGLAGRYGREPMSRACKKGFTLPANPMFDAFERLEAASDELRAIHDQWLRWAHREALTDVRRSVRRRIRTDRRLAYDDLLIELEDALADAGGKRLAMRIRREFPCALIDEYQDTDPVQARIFGRIYGEVEAASAETDRAGWDLPGDMAGAQSRRSDETVVTPDAASPAHGPEPGGRVEPIEGEGACASRRGEHPRSGPFIVVGDPKQSIYRFRGADVFAYLASRRTAKGRLHLDRNWRSVPALVEAVNVVFAGADPFVVHEIEYRPVAAAGTGDSPLRLPSGECAGPLEFRLLPRPQDGKPLAKKDASPVVAGATANEIARLLECGARGDASIDGRPLTGANVAVLVRTREQGRLMAGELRERGVRSVEIDDGSVFHTREAEQLERLLWALAEPGREARVRGTLAGDLFGLGARALLALGEDEAEWSAWAGRIADWRSHWESRGIGSVLLRLLEAEGGATHLLGRRDGARRLTNFRHLAELLQAAETRERLAPAELAAWLNRRRADPDGPDDDAKLRIESDEQLVRVLTVHGSKGLEFPVVFCPFAWDARGPGRRRDSVDAVYHRGAADGYREIIDLDPDPRAEAREWLEEFSESVRLLYVALTRAKYRCVVAWGQVRGAGHSPLAWLLHRSDDGRTGSPDPVTAQRQPAGSAAGKRLGANDTDTSVGAPPVEEFGGGDGGTSTGATEGGSSEDDPDTAIAALQAVANRFDGLGAKEWLGEMRAFARRSPGAVSVSVLDPEPPPVRAPAVSEDVPPALAARELHRPLRRIRSLTSFSALSAGAHSAAGAGRRSPARREEADVDRPDHDQHEAPADAPGDDTSAPGDDTSAAGGRAGERTAFTFPRGPVAGSCLHRIFERLDAPPGTGADRPDPDEICAEALDDFGIDGAWRAVARTMVERARAVLLRESEPGSPEGAPGGADSTGSLAGPDAGGFRLADPHRRLVELEFHFPVEGLDRDRLAARMVEHGYPDPFAGARPVGPSASAPPIHGFLRGFVDLVVEHAGRWYVLDYKSNWLGPGPADYGPEALGAAMREGGYTLQSLVYLVALHRYLAVRLPGYEYERHVGGAFYLFVRGIDPAAGMDRGVHFDRPTAECLHALDDCFRSGVA